jgi:hypothetical protein
MGSPRGVSGTSRNLPRPGSLGGDRASRMARPVTAPGAQGTNQRNQVIATGATAGTFTLRVRARSAQLDVTTAAINWNDSLAAVVSKLDTALSPGSRVSGVSGGPLPAATVVEFTGDLGSQDVTLSVNSNSLTGGTPVVSTTQAASAGAVGVRDAARRFGYPGTKGSLMARPRGLGR